MTMKNNDQGKINHISSVSDEADATQKRNSKFLSLVLRHKPETLGLQLDAQGWVEIASLLQAFKQYGKRLNRQQLEQICANCEKQRFKISDDGLRIRANQGHTVKIDLALPEAMPPAVLYHGTASRFIASIFEKGLQAGSRQHVHMTDDLATAKKVGARHGKPVILRVDAAGLALSGQVFYRSENKVWLSTNIAPAYLSRFEDTPD